MTDNALAVQNQPTNLEAIERALIQGDLSGLNPREKIAYYHKTCESMGLNPYTKPFEYLKLNGKEILYWKKDATDQLRKLHRISIQIMAREKVGDILVVTARAFTPDGRQDESTGAVCLGNTRGDALANLMMKAETKAKRRVTLSIVGLGGMDESEVEGIPGAQRISVEEMHAQAQLPPKQDVPVAEFRETVAAEGPAPQPPQFEESAEFQAAERVDDAPSKKLVTEPQLRRLYAITKAHGWHKDEVVAWMREHLKKDSSKDLDWMEYNRLCQYLQTRAKVEHEQNGPHHAQRPE